MSADTASPPASPFTPPERSRSWRGDRVPVEHRFLGLDKRSFPWAFAVLGVWFFWVVLVPHVDRWISSDDEVRAGERFAVTSDLAFTPSAGWTVISGFRADERSAGSDVEPVVLSSGGVAVVVRTDEFSGTPNDLIEQLDEVTLGTDESATFRTTSGRSTVTTDSRLVGATQDFTTGQADGRFVAFVVDGTGIEMTITGPADQLSGRSDELAAIVASLGPRDADAGSTS